VQADVKREPLAHDFLATNNTNNSSNGFVIV
jgi:hypothetical protein